METNQPMASNRDQMHKTISRWQLLELIGLANEIGLEGTQIRQILAAEYGVNPDYTSRLLVELVQKGYVISQPAPSKKGTKGGRNRKVYIRTDKANDLPDKPIPCEVALTVESGPSSQETRTEIDAPTIREEAQATVTPVSAPTIQPAPDTSPAPVEPGPASVETPPAPDTQPHEVTPSTTTTVHEALATAMDQFSDLLLLQVAHKLGAFVANQMAPLERATGELCAQIDAIRAQLDTITQHLGSLAAVPVPPPHQARPSTMGRQVAPAGTAVSQGDGTASTVHRPSNVAGQSRNKNDKKATKTLAEQKGGPRSTHPGQRKLKALLIGVPSEQEQPIRERFGGRYDLLFLNADARFGKVRAIRDQYEIVLGLEDTCSSAIKDALKGHPHKAILPQSSQLMDELEEYFQLQLEQSQTGSAG